MNVNQKVRTLAVGEIEVRAIKWDALKQLIEEKKPKTTFIPAWNLKSQDLRNVSQYWAKKSEIIFVEFNEEGQKAVFKNSKTGKKVEFSTEAPCPVVPASEFHEKHAQILVAAGKKTGKTQYFADFCGDTTKELGDLWYYLRNFRKIQKQKKQRQAQSSQMVDKVVDLREMPKALSLVGISFFSIILAVIIGFFVLSTGTVVTVKTVEIIMDYTLENATPELQTKFDNVRQKAQNTYQINTWAYKEIIGMVWMLDVSGSTNELYKNSIGTPSQMQKLANCLFVPTLVFDPEIEIEVYSFGDNVYTQDIMMTKQNYKTYIDIGNFYSIAENLSESTQTAKAFNNLYQKSHLKPYQLIFFLTDGDSNNPDLAYQELKNLSADPYNFTILTTVVDDWQDSDLYTWASRLPRVEFIHIDIYDFSENDIQQMFFRFIKNWIPDSELQKSNSNSSIQYID